jgi:hypothetical protein
MNMLAQMFCSGIFEAFISVLGNTLTARVASGSTASNVVVALPVTALALRATEVHLRICSISFHGDAHNIGAAHVIESDP